MKTIHETKDSLFSVALGIFVAVIHIPFLLTNLDFNNDAAAYSLSIATPFFSGNYSVQLPGYISYIYLGRFFNYFLNDPILVQNVINIILSGLIVIGMYFLLKKLNFNRLESCLFSVLFSVLNVILLGGLTGGGRLFHVLAAILLIYTAHSTLENKHALLKFAFLLAFFMGFRQDLSFMFGFLFLYLFFIVKDFKLILAAIGIFIAVCLLWFVPLVMEYGGVTAFFQKLLTQFDDAVAPTSVLINGFSIVPLLNIVRLLFYVANCLFFVLIIFVVSKFPNSKPMEKPLKHILLIALLPAFLFQLFVHSGNFVLLTAFIVPLHLLLIMNYKFTSKRKMGFVLIIMVFVILQFFTVKMIDNPDRNQKGINTLWLQWSYDGAKSGKLLTFRQVDE